MVAAPLANEPIAVPAASNAGNENMNPPCFEDNALTCAIDNFRSKGMNLLILLICVCVSR
ncbi:unnamed protein product, partial [Rotaria magnacalcarata]